MADAVLGRIAIPLFNCKGLKKYILKDPKLAGVGKILLADKIAIFRKYPSDLRKLDKNHITTVVIPKFR